MSDAISYSAPSSTGRSLGSDRFIGRVPVAICFLTQLPDPWPVVAGFDERLVEFGHRRVQVLIAIDAPPDELETYRDAHTVAVPLLSDQDGSLRSRFDADMDDQGRIATVVLDTEGVAVDTVRQLPRPDHVLAVLERLDELQRDMPDRFVPLPDEAERVRAQRETIVDEPPAAPPAAPSPGDGLPDATARLGRATGEARPPAS